MRQAAIMASVMVLVAIFSGIAGHTIVTNAPKNQSAASAGDWVGVMDLMRGAKNLPQEDFDAH